MKSVFPLGVFLVAVGLFVTTGFGSRSSQLERPVVNVKDLPERGLSIVSPSDAEYMELVSDLLEGKSDPIVETLAPYSIFLRNTANHAVVACLLKWEMVTPGGKKLLWIREYTNFQPLMEQSISEVKEGLAIRSGSRWFFTPSSLRFHQVPSTDDSRPEVIEQLNKTLTQLAHFASISVSLDGAFFDDGTFVGPDTTGFFARVEAMRNGRRDTLLEMINDKRLGKSDAEVFKHLADLANQKVATNPKEPSEFYNSYKRDTANEFLRLRAVDGEAKTLGRAENKLKGPWPKLKKL